MCHSLTGSVYRIDMITLSQEDRKRIGKVTSAIHSPRLKKNIGYAWPPVEQSKLGTTVTVETEWGTRTATVVEMPFVDANKRIPVS